MGLLSLAFDQNYKNNYIYVHYNDKNDNTIISRFNVFNGIADEQLKNILKLKQPYMNHNGGTATFGQMLFIYRLGDGVQLEMKNTVIVY